MKYKALVFFMAAASVAAACQSVEPDTTVGGQPGAREVIITAEMESPAPATRTETEQTLVNGERTYPMYWLPGDKIMIYSAGESSVFTNIYEERTRIAKFKGTISGITGADDGSATDYVWGFYPSSLVQNYAEPDGISETAVLTAELPSTQKSKAESYATDLALMVGRAESTAIYFKSVYSCIYFTFDREDIISVSFKGVGDEVLAGKIEITMDASGNPVHTPVVGGTASEVTMMAPDGGTFAKNTKYYMILLPRVLSSGFTVTLRTQGGLEGSFTNSGSLSLNRNGFRQLATPDKRIEHPENYNNTTSTGWHQATTQGLNEIWYTTKDGVKWNYQTSSGTGNVILENIAPSENTENPGVGVIRFEAPVTVIDSDAHGTNRTKLTSVILPDLVETIDYQAFYGCTYLKDIQLGSHVKTIGQQAFQQVAVSSISFPESLETIGQWAFVYCYELQQVTLPESLQEFTDNPFLGCRGLTGFYGKGATDDHVAVILDQEGVRTLASFAPGALTNGTFTVPADVEAIGPCAFYDATVASVILPVGLKTIGQEAFLSAAHLTHITLPASVEELEAGAFRACTALETVKILKADEVISTPYDDPAKLFMDIPDECIIYVPSALLRYYKNYRVWETWAGHYQPLQENNQIYLSLPSDASAEDLDWSAFGGNAPTVTYNEDMDMYIATFDHVLTAIPAMAFTGTSLTGIIIPDSVTQIGDHAFEDCGNLTSVTLPDGLTTLGEYAFGGDISLVTIRIPESLTTFGNAPFIDCSSLTSFTGSHISEDGRCIVVTANGVTYLHDFAPAGLEGQQYRVPAGIQVIRTMNSGTFNNVWLPSSVQRILGSAFADCQNLQDINIPVSVEFIGSNAFRNCPNLRQVGFDSAVPPTLASATVFQYTNDTYRLMIPGAGFTNWNSDAMWSSSYGDHFYYYQANNEIWYHLTSNTGSAAGPVDLFNYTTLNSPDPYRVTTLAVVPPELQGALTFGILYTADGSPVTSVPDNAFSGNGDIDFVSVPNTVTTIGAAAFKGCTSLLESPLGTNYNLTTIGDEAFRGCTSLKYTGTNRGSTLVSIPYVTTVGARAYQGCTSMQRIRFHHITSLGKSAFKDCTALTDAMLGPITEFKDSTFAGCSLLESVSLTQPDILTTVGKAAFRACKKLTTVDASVGTGQIYLPGVTTVQSEGFASCLKVTTLNLPELLTAGNDAFYRLGSNTSGTPNGSSVLTAVSVPKLQEIQASYVFGYVEINELHLPGIQSIGRVTFGYSHIGGIHFGPNLTTMADYLFVSMISPGSTELFFEGTTTIPSFGSATFNKWNSSDIISFSAIHVPHGYADAYRTALHNANSAYSAYDGIIIDDI